MALPNLQVKTSRQEIPLFVTALAYLITITLAELLTTYIEPRVGLLLHALLLQILLFHAARADKTEQRAFLFSMVLAPLIRIVSLSLPLTKFPVLYWYAITSLPLFAATLLTGRALGLSWKELGLNLRRWPLQIAIGLSGLVFGTIEYLILRPEPLIPALKWTHLWWPALILLISTGLMEEMIFRGLLQRVTQTGLGRWGLAYVALLFAILHIGYRSLTDLIFVLSVGLFMGWVVQRTGSLMGVTLAHALTNILLFLVMPFLVLRKLFIPNPLDYLIPAVGTPLVDGLVLAGWLLFSAAALAALGRRQTLQGKRILSAALAIALLRAVRMFWPAPHLEGALTAAEPLLLAWPFITASIPSQIAHSLMGSALYTLALALAAIWGLPHNYAMAASPEIVPNLWMALTIGGAVAGQLLLWRQRHLAVRAALLLLTIGAASTVFGSPTVEALIPLMVFPLLLIELYFTTRSSAPSPAPATTVRSVAKPKPISTPTPAAPHRHNELEQKRQLLSLLLSSVVAFDAPPLPELLRAMLKALTSTLEADAAYILLKHDRPEPGLVLANHYKAQHPSSSLHPTVFSETKLPLLFHALRRDRTLIYNEREWGDNRVLDVLYSSLDETRPGPTIIYPLVYQEHNYGLLIVGNPHSKKSFSKHASRLCKVLAARLATVAVDTYFTSDRTDQAKSAAAQPSSVAARMPLSSTLAQL